MSSLPKTVTRLPFEPRPSAPESSTLTTRLPEQGLWNFLASVPSDRHTPLLRVCCCGPSGQTISIDCCTAGGPAVSSSRGAAAWDGRMRAVTRCQLTYEAEHRRIMLIKMSYECAIYINIYTVSQKSEPPKHFATAIANLHRFKWFTHTRRHLFLSSTSNFIRIPYSVYEMFNSFKLLLQISVTDTTYFLLTSSVVTGVTSVRVDKQTTCYKNAESWRRIRW